MCMCGSSLEITSRVFVEYPPAQIIFASLFSIYMYMSVYHHSTYHLSNALFHPSFILTLIMREHDMERATSHLACSWPDKAVHWVVREHFSMDRLIDWTNSLTPLCAYVPQGNNSHKFRGEPEDLGNEAICSVMYMYMYVYCTDS